MDIRAWTYAPESRGWVTSKPMMVPALLLYYYGARKLTPSIPRVARAPSSDSAFVHYAFGPWSSTRSGGFGGRGWWVLKISLCNPFRALTNSRSRVIMDKQLSMWPGSDIGTGEQRSLLHQKLHSFDSQVSGCGNCASKACPGFKAEASVSSPP